MGPEAQTWDQSSWDASVPAAPSSEEARTCGTVKSFRGEFGFVSVEGLQGDVMVHVRDNPGLGAPPVVGEILEFDVRDQGGKMRGFNATRYGEPPQAAAAMTEAAAAPAAVAATPEGFFEGTLASFRDGWGLIESPSLEGKLFCGAMDNPSLSQISPGDAVTFQLGTNPKDGRNKAVNVTATVRECEQAECIGQRVKGRVKSVRGDWGFAASAAFKGDIMVGQKNLRAAGITIMQNMVLEFEVAAAPNGRCEATNIRALGGGPRMAAGWTAPQHNGWGAPPNNGWGQPTQSMGRSMPSNGAAGARDRSRTPVPQQGPQGPRRHGSVKNFRDGWGFLVCGEVAGDIYCNLNDSPQFAGPPLQPGEAVEFSLVQRGVAQGGRNNGAQAVHVVRAEGPGAWAPRHVPPTRAHGPAPMHARPPAPARAHAPASGSHFGTVKVFKDGWGFISGPGLVEDVFFGLKDNPHIPSANVGDSFTFEVTMGPKGRPRAVNAQASILGHQVAGTLKTIKDGWGFAVVDGVQGDVLLGKKNLFASGIDLNSMQVGDAVVFEMAMGPKGYEATNIQSAA